MTRFNQSQLRSQLRRIEQKQRQAVNDYNREVRRVNAHNKRVVDEYNRKILAHNERIRSNRRRLLNELNRLNSRSATRTTTRYVTYEASVHSLQRSFARIEQASEQERWIADDELFEMAEGEAANSVAVLNVLLDESTTDGGVEARLQETVLTTELSEISPELNDRWSGALFALSPANRDAARQFCTSAREILVGILNVKAPKQEVLAAKPDVTLINGEVPRREQIYYCLARSGQEVTELVDFVAEDINNVMELFPTLNPATHGEAGLYDFTQLQAIKTRVEGAIQFLHRVVSVHS